MKKSFLLSVIAFLFAAAFTGCENMMDNSSSQNHPAKTVTVTGSLNMGGALPSEIIKKLNQAASAAASKPASVKKNSKQSQENNRSAFPSIPDANLTFDIKAENTAEGSTEAYNAENIVWADKTFEIGIPLSDTEKTFKITAKVKWNNNEILYGESRPFTISQDSPFVTSPKTDVTISAKQTTGENPASGSIALEIEIDPDCSIDYCKINEATYPIESGKITFAESSFTSGNHLLDFSFYNNTDEVLYSFKESISVFDNMKTDTWIQNGNAPWFETSESNGIKTTKCKITKAMIDSFQQLTEIYVNPDAAADGSGTFFNPVGTFNAALNLLKDANKDYTIYIEGNLLGSHELPDTTTNAKSLTICGKRGLDVNGIPQDSLNGNEEGSVLKIETSVPVTIKNLKITNGVAANGGGIYTKGDLTLESGTLITENKASSNGCNGGGIYNEGGILKIKSGAEISSNKAGTNQYPGKGAGLFNLNGTVIISGGIIRDNSATQGGGGIYNKSENGLGTIFIYGKTNIEENKGGDGIGGGIANSGGLIYLGYSGHLGDTYGYAPDPSKEIEWTGRIYKNTSKAGGGGISIASTTPCGLVFLNSGEISGNSGIANNSWGGGVLSNDNGFTMSGGIIKNNSADKGGAIANSFNIKGTAWIPAGVKDEDGNFETGKGKNDIELYSYSNIITITGSLTPPAEANGTVATITPNDYSSDLQFLYTSDFDTNLANEVYKFAITPDPATSQTYTFAASGKMAQSVEFTNENIGSFSGASSLTNGQEYHFVIGSDVTNTNFNNFMEKMFNSTSINISENSTLDLSKATGVTGSQFPGVTMGTQRQPFEFFIIGPNFSATWCENQNPHASLYEVKKFIAPPNCANFSTDNNGLLYSKDGSKLKFYPSGGTATVYNIPEGVTEISSFAVSWNSKYTSITLPDTVEIIGQQAFDACNTLTGITVPSSVKKIEKNAFPNRTTFTSLIFKDTSGWHYDSINGEPIALELLNAEGYKESLENHILVKE